MQELFLELAKLSLIGSLFSAVVILLRFVFRKAPKWVFCLLWGMVALRLICPFSVESNLSLVPDNLANGQILSNVEDTYIGRGETIEIYDNAVPEGNRQPIGSFVTEEGTLQPAKTIGNTVFPVLGWIWLAGMILMFVYTAVSYLTLYKKMEEATHLQDNIWQCEQVDTPFVLGFIKPRIYLPYAISDVDMANVIAHEQAHIYRKDHWWKPIGFLILSVHWFNPILWLAYILLCRDIEAACDEKVVKHMGKDEVRAYSTALLNYSIQRRRIAACPLAFGEVGVKERVKSVMNYKKPTLWIIIVAVVICAVVAVCFLTNPKTSSEKNLNRAAGEILDSNGNVVKRQLKDAIIIKDNDSGKIVYDGTQKDSLFSTDIYMVDNKTGEIIDLEKSPMTAAQLISFFVNGGKEMLDGPVNWDVRIAKSDVQQIATIHSNVVKTASVTFRYTYDTDAVQEPGEFGDVKVVLTDGTVINVLGPYGLPGDNGEFVSTYATTEAIPTEDIDYIRIGETIVAIPHQIIHQGNPMIPAP